MRVGTDLNRGPRPRVRLGCRSGSFRLGVHRNAHLLAQLAGFLYGVFDRLSISATQSLLQLSDSLFRLRLDILGYPVLVLVQESLDLIGHRVGLAADLGHFAALTVLRG